MSRPRQYDREEVLAKTTDLFWERGFEATSMNDVVARTNVNKYSLYNEFGDKEKLFLACIDHYICNSSSVEEILAKKPLGLSNIEIFFEERVRYATSKECKGCLIFNSVIENEILSEEINLKVNSCISKLKTFLYNCLQAAQERKEINKNKDCKALANYLACFIFGLVNIGMKETSKEEVREIADFALSVVKS